MLVGVTIGVVVLLYVGTCVSKFRKLNRLEREDASGKAISARTWGGVDNLYLASAHECNTTVDAPVVCRKRAIKHLSDVRVKQAEDMFNNRLKGAKEQ